MSKKTKYVPPAVEMVLLEPCEKLAAWEWGFDTLWKNPGYYPAKEGLASAIVTTGGFADTDYTGESGFVIKE